MQHVVNSVTQLIADNGLIAVFVLMMLESACIPIPSEVIMLYAGYLVSQHQMTLLGAVTAGVAGNVVGSWIAWAVGAYGGYVYLERHGHWLHITPRKLERSHAWFERYGPVVVLVSRCLPIVRTFISLPAGVARMPFWRFTLYTAIGCVPWVLMLTLVGEQVGANWESWHRRFQFLDYVVAAGVVAGIVYLVLHARRAASAGAE